MIEDDKSDVIDARNKIVRILDQQTIRRVENECQALLAEENLPNFREFVENQSNFILTDRRKDILEQIQDRLAAEESPAVILHGSYGSGKTVLMETISDLCHANQEIGDVTFPQFTYGDTEIDCFKISLQEHDSPQKFLLRLYKAVLSSDDLSEDDLIDRFNREKSALSLDGLESLPDSMKSELKGYFNDPQSLEEIATACKSLSAPSAHETITWFASEYYAAEGQYPGFYVDEFEQVFRHLDPTEEHTLKRLIKKMMRSSVTSHEELDTPPYILFLNSVGLNELDETIQAAEDLVSRLEQSIAYNIDLSKEETKHLFSELYHLYASPLLEDHSETVPDWQKTISSASPDKDDYHYPFTDHALEFTLNVVDTDPDSDRDEPVVRAFRAYKSVLMAFLETWEGDSVIDRNYLYRYGDDIRDKIAQLERAESSRLPGRNSIRNRIEEDYEEEGLPLQRVLTELAKVGILERDDQPALFSPREIEEIADDAQVDLTISISEFVRQAAGKTKYFSEEGDHLALDQAALTGAAATEETKPNSEIVRETVEALELTQKDTRKLWEAALRQEFATDLDIQDKGNYLEIDVLGEFQYTESVYFSVGSGEPPAELDAKVDSKAFHFAVHLGPSDDSAVPAEFVVEERNDRSDSIADDIADALNEKIGKHVDDDENASVLLEYIDDAYGSRSEYEQYRLFLKLSLSDILGEELPEEIKARTSSRSVFDILRYVRENVKGQYRSDEYVPDKLGLSNGYSGQDVLDVVYGIKHLKNEGELIYQNPNIFDITRELRTISQLSRGNKSGDGFKAVLEKFSDERFIEEDDGDFDVLHDFSEGTQTALNTLEEALHNSADDELSFEDILKELFGTSVVASVTEAYVYLILSVVDLYGNPFILSGDQDGKIVLPESKLETVRDQTKNALEDAIKREALAQAKADEPDYSTIEAYKEDYENLDQYDDTEDLEDIVEGLATDYTVDTATLEQDVRSIASKSVYAESEVSEYITAVRNPSEFESGLPFLIESDLLHLVDQLDSAAEVLEAKETVLNYADTVSTLTSDTIETEAADIEIDCVDAVGEHLESHDVSGEVANSTIDDDVTDFIEGDADSEMLVSQLSRLRKAIVPRVDEYDPSEHNEIISQDIEQLELQFQNEVSDREKKVERAREQLAEYEPRIPDGESARIETGRRHLDQCERALEDSIDEFDADQYNSLWSNWEATESNLAKLALSNDDIGELIEDLGLSIESDKVTQANTDLNEIVEGLDDEADFSKLVTSLRVEVDAAQQMQAALIKRWLQERDSK